MDAPLHQQEVPPVSQPPAWTHHMLSRLSGTRGPSHNCVMPAYDGLDPTVFFQRWNRLEAHLFHYLKRFWSLYRQNAILIRDIRCLKVAGIGKRKYVLEKLFVRLRIGYDHALIS